MNLWIMADSAGAGTINQLKVRWGESTRWRKVEDVHPNNNHVIPVAFSTSHKAMLANLHLMATKGLLAINPKYEKLITSLRTAYCKDAMDLDKAQSSYNDLLDALRLSLKGYQIE